VPAIVVDRIMLYTDKLRYRKKIDFARMLCRYWSLKREARRGAPLLKRLHLEPWTASAGAKVQTEEDKLMRLDVCVHLMTFDQWMFLCSWFVQQLNRLRQDLINVKALTQLSLEREGTKFRQTEIGHDILVAALLPLHASLRSAFERIMRQVSFLLSHSSSLLLLNAWPKLVLTRRITLKIPYRRPKYPITLTSSRIPCVGP